VERTEKGWQVIAGGVLLGSEKGNEDTRLPNHSEIN